VGIARRALLGGAQAPGAPRADELASAVPPDPRAAWLPAAVRPMASGEPPRRYETRVRAWYEDRAGFRHDPDAMLAWGSEPVRAVIMAAAVADGLPRLTLPRRQPSVSRRAPSSSRRRS